MNRWEKKKNPYTYRYISLSLFFISSKKYALTLCLKVFTFVQFFKSDGILFQTVGVIKEMQFCPIFVFLSGWLNFLLEFLVTACWMQDLSNTSFIYRGHLSLKNLKAFVNRHYLNLKSTGSQLIFSISDTPTCALSFNLRQNLTHLFRNTCNLVLSFLLRFGYQTEHA